MDKGRATDVIYLSKHLTLYHTTSLSLNWRGMDLTDGSLGGQGIGSMVALTESQSMAQRPNGDQ